MLILSIFFRFVSFIIRPSFFKRISDVFTIFYSFWMANSFKSFNYTSRLHCYVQLRGGKYITIGSKSGIGKRTIITAWDHYRDEKFQPSISIGDNVWIGEDAHITAINSILISHNVLIGKKVTITDNSHGDSSIEALMVPPAERSLYSKGPVIIKENVWIGDKSTILPNVTIGRNAIIGANSVVTKDVPDNTVIAGSPAVIVKYIDCTINQ